MAEAGVQDYGWTTAKSPHSCAYLAPYILDRLRSLGIKRVLDLGSGNGALCGQLAEAGYEVAGVEYDRQGVEIASRSYPSITFYNFGVQDDPAALLAQERPFDAVVSTEVVEHLFSPHQLPQYARAVLNPGGRLILTTPYHGYLKNLALTLTDHWDKHHDPLWHGGHIKFWSRATLSRLLRENGFEVTRFGGVGRMPYLWKSMILEGRRA